MKKRVLVIGGAGFIGSHLVCSLLGDGHSVTSIDISDAGVSTRTGVEVRLDPEYTFIRTHNPYSNSKYAEMFNADFGNFDVIYFLAGHLGVENVIKNPNDCIEGNILPMIDFLHNGSPNSRFFFASSSEVYGNSENKSEDASLSIGSSIRWNYACSKLMCEFLIRGLMTNYVVGRLFNITGPGQYPDSGMVMPNFIANAKTGLPLDVYNGGTQIRSFCHVKDCVNLMRSLVEDTKEIGTFNIGCPENETSILDLARSVKEITGSNSEIKLMDAVEKFKIDVSDYGDVVHRIPPINKLRTALKKDYKFLNLTDIIKSMI